MCSYCGARLNADSLNMVYENDVVYLCDEECAIYYYQEQQQRSLQSWVKIR